jgi:hypothetical protein
VLFVVGQARERQDVIAPEIAQDPRAPMFLISTRSKEQVSSGMNNPGYARPKQGNGSSCCLAECECARRLGYAFLAFYASGFGLERNSRNFSYFIR